MIEDIQHHEVCWQREDTVFWDHEGVSLRLSNFSFVIEI